MALWEKQKKWQQTAEKLKEKLKEKTEELQKLQTNHEKLRSVVSCMEREKWYLRSKLKLEKNGMSSGFTFYPPVSTADLNIVEDLQKECDLLKSRINELTERLVNEDNDQLRNIIEEQKSRISALEPVAEVNIILKFIVYQQGHFMTKETSGSSISLIFGYSVVFGVLNTYNEGFCKIFNILPDVVN